MADQSTEETRLLGAAAPGMSDRFERARRALAPAAVAMIPTAAGLWLLLSPPFLFSREMTWDLLFNLEGAWQLAGGQVLHVDAHDPLGVLSFALTEIGFALVGTSPRAFLVGIAIFAGLSLALAAIVATRRLPLFPAALFILYCGALVLLPTNVGDAPNTYSFAMSYNRLGWSVLAILFLALFTPPRREDAAGVDLVAAAAALAILFYLKITYFFAGLGGLAVALRVAPHLRALWRRWLGLLAIAALWPLLPFNAPYLADIWNAVGAGAVRSDPLEIVRAFFEDKAESALALTGLALALWAWRRDRFGAAAAAGIASTIGAGIFVLSQNAQHIDVPLYGVIAFLLYGLGERVVTRLPRASGVRPLLAAALIFPALGVAATATSLVGYYRHAASGADAFAVTDTNLRGLAVPSEPARLLDAFADGQMRRHLLNDVRRLGVRYELSQFEYLRTIVDATEVLAPTAHPPHEKADGPRILVLDSVNPLPFALGLPAPRGGDLWIGSGMPWRAADEVFAEVDIVMIPKFPSDAGAQSEAVARYGDYIDRHFTRWRETRYWTALTRATPSCDTCAPKSTEIPHPS